MRRFLLSVIMMIAGLSMASAEEPVQGIIVTYEGSETSYKLEDMPTVKYETAEGVRHAVLYLKNVAEPVLNVALADGKALVVAYGVYTPSVVEGIESDKVTITERNGRKFIQGGKLIIIGKDGKKYNANGIEIKK